MGKTSNLNTKHPLLLVHKGCSRKLEDALAYLESFRENYTPQTQPQHDHESALIMIAPKLQTRATPPRACKKLNLGRALTKPIRGENLFSYLRPKRKQDDTDPECTLSNYAPKRMKSHSLNSGSNHDEGKVTGVKNQKRLRSPHSGDEGEHTPDTRNTRKRRLYAITSTEMSPIRIDMISIPDNSTAMVRLPRQLKRGRTAESGIDVEDPNHDIGSPQHDRGFEQRNALRDPANIREGYKAGGDDIEYLTKLTGSPGLTCVWIGEAVKQCLGRGKDQSTILVINIDKRDAIRGELNGTHWMLLIYTVCASARSTYTIIDSYPEEMGSGDQAKQALIQHAERLRKEHDSRKGKRIRSIPPPRPGEILEEDIKVIHTGHQDISDNWRCGYYAMYNGIAATRNIDPMTVRLDVETAVPTFLKALWKRANGYYNTTPAVPADLTNEDVRLSFPTRPTGSGPEPIASPRIRSDQQTPSPDLPNKEKGNQIEQEIDCNQFWDAEPDQYCYSEEEDNQAGQERDWEAIDAANPVPESENEGEENVHPAPRPDIDKSSEVAIRPGWIFMNHKLSSKGLTAFCNKLSFTSTTEWILNARKIHDLPDTVVIIIDRPENRPQAKNTLAIVDIKRRQIMCPAHEKWRHASILNQVIRDQQKNTKTHGVTNYNDNDNKINLEEIDQEEAAAHRVPLSWHTLWDAQIPKWTTDMRATHRWATIRRDHRTRIGNLVDEWMRLRPERLHLEVREGPGNTWFVLANRLGGLNPIGKHTIIWVDAQDNIKVNAADNTTHDMAIALIRRAKRPGDLPRSITLRASPTKPMTHEIALEYHLPVNIPIEISVPNTQILMSADPDPSPSAPSAPKQNEITERTKHMADSIARVLAQIPRTVWKCEPLRNIAASYLHTCGTMKTTAAWEQQGSCWHSENELEKCFGATTCSEQDFIKTKLVWVNPTTEDESTRLANLTISIATSSDAMCRKQGIRMAILIPDSKKVLHVLKKSAKSKHCYLEAIALFKRDLLPLQRLHSVVSEEENQLSNPPMALVVIQNRYAPPFDMRSLQKDIRTAFPECELPVAANWKGSLKHFATTRANDREPLRVYPTMSWMRPPIGDPPSDAKSQESLASIDFYDPLASGLGILPKRFTSLMIKAGHDRTMFKPGVSQNIRTLMIETTMSIYRDWEYHRVEKLYGLKAIKPGFSEKSKFKYTKSSKTAVEDPAPEKEHQLQ